jgi:hypothetical protein
VPEVESPLDRNDVTAILTGLFDANAKLDRSSTSWGSMMKRKRKSRLTADFWERDRANMRLLEERIAYHERKLAGERSKRP